MSEAGQLGAAGPAGPAAAPFQGSPSLPHPATPSGVRFLLHRFQLHPRRRLGQNFLVDRTVAERLAQAAGVGPGERVVEVGAGLGALTLALAGRGAQVVALERDPRLAEALRWVLTEWCRPAVLGRGVWVVVADALEQDLERLVGGGVVAANLPYGITGPFLMKLVRSHAWRRAVLTLQYEVVQRLVARPGSPEYGSLTVAVQARATVQRLFTVSRRCFLPAPEVDSAAVVLQPKADGPPAALQAALEQVLRAGFGQRRKRLRNALAGLVAGQGPSAPQGGRPQAGAFVEQLLARAGLDGEVRAEELNVEQFLRLARAWMELQQAPPTGTAPEGEGPTPATAAP